MSLTMHCKSTALHIPRYRSFSGFHDRWLKRKGNCMRNKNNMKTRDQVLLQNILQTLPVPVQSVCPLNCTNPASEADLPQEACGKTPLSLPAAFLSLTVCVTCGDTLQQTTSCIARMTDKRAQLNVCWHDSVNPCDKTGGYAQ